MVVCIFFLTFAMISHLFRYDDGQVYYQIVETSSMYKMRCQNLVLNPMEFFPRIVLSPCRTVFNNGLKLSGGVAEAGWVRFLTSHYVT